MVLFDEADGLIGEAMVLFLTQLRQGYIHRSQVRHAIEVKLRRDTTTAVRALAQLVEYLDNAGLEEGWLVMFDLRKEVPWSEKLTLEQVQAEGKRIWVVGG